MSLFYEVRDRIDYIRNPFSHSGEGKTRKRNENESSEEKEIFDLAYIVYERYEAERTSFQKLSSIKYRFISVFGIKHTEPFDEVNKIVYSILSASQILARNYWKSRGESEWMKSNSIFI